MNEGSGRSARRIGFGAGLVVLVMLASIGVWSIYGKLTDPRRLARLAVEDGSAATAVEAALAGGRLCGRVLSGREPFRIGGFLARLPSTRTLIAAGLIERMPASGRPQDNHDPLYRMTAAAAPFVLSEPLGDSRRVSLCYGRPKLDQVSLEGDGRLDPAPVLRLMYTVADRPGWAERPDMRVAFPFLREITAGANHSSARIRFDGAKPKLDGFAIDPEGNERWLGLSAQARGLDKWIAAG